jgi:hypothetical protein
MTTRLPRGEEAILDIRKIEDYCLNPLHPRGRHKARVFREALNLQRDDAVWLETLCLKPHASARPARLGQTPGGPIGGSTRPSGDKVVVLW